MKELGVYAAVLVLNDLNPLRVLHMAFEFIGKMITAPANVNFLILCMKENSLVRVITLGLWPKETNLCYYIFFFVQMPLF